MTDSAETNRSENAESDRSTSATGTGDRAIEDYNTESFKHALEEARRTFDHQITAYEDADEKSWRVLRFNGLVGTIAVAGAVNIPPPFSIWELGAFVVGILLLGTSTVLVFRGLPHNEVGLGASREFLDRVGEKNPPEEVYLHWTINQYADWTELARKRTIENSSRVDLSKLLSLLGVGVLIVGGLYHTVSLAI